MTKRLPRMRHLAAAMLGVILFAAPATGQNLSIAEVQSIVAAAALEAQAQGRLATIAVVDRVGNVLTVFDMNATRTQTTITTNRGIAKNNGLENVQQVFTSIGNTTSPSTRLAAIAKAVTGAYLSSGGNAFTTRTASQIVQEHFNPGEKFSPSGPLFGVQFSQLPCSDLSVRQATNSAAPTGLSSSTIGPKRSPLGLSADPGGVPLYKGGTVVGGLGVEADRIYTIDPKVLDYDNPVDEIIALAGQSSFQPPEDIKAHRIFVEGKSLRYLDVTQSSLKTNPASASFAAVNGVLGNAVAVTGYATATFLAGQTYGTTASGFAPDAAGTFSFVGNQVFVLYDGALNPRYPPTASTFPTVGNGGMTANEVATILGNAMKVAFAARAQIRRPLGSSHAQVTASVVDLNGNVLGIVRTPDGPIFGTDVSLQKARTATLFSSRTAGTYLGTYNNGDVFGLGTAVGKNVLGVTIGDFVNAVRGLLGSAALADGTAFADRSGGNLSRPFFPDGIDGNPHGPLSKPFDVWSPFNTGLQLDVVTDNLVQNIRFADGAGSVDSSATCSFFTRDGVTNLTRISNGFQIFPGSVPIYRNNVVIGGIGVSGDGVDQDDMISFLGLDHAAAALNTGLGNASRAQRADQLSPGGTHLRYVNCPYKPFLHSRTRQVCAGK